MFHVITEKSIPVDYLYSGSTHTRIDGVFYNHQEDGNAVMCGAPVGQRREAISYKDCMSYLNQGRLRSKQLCRACAKALKITVKREETSNVSS